MNYDAADSLALMLAILMVILFVAVVVAMCGMITYGITSIWQEELVNDTFEVEILDKSMEDSYKIFVKGVNLDGEEFCKTYVISANEYAHLNIGDVLMVQQRETTQPIFGNEVSYSLIRDNIVPSAN